ncbi:LONG CHAIN BASE BIOSYNTHESIS 2A-LIKE PROTEIN [Salix koriyanagi]|uniref:LONG CHAIN BASE BIOSYNTHESIS 2A-LIKE PROTEIN n=1 Tax=Salix koriyanagi TaxID=2511006 RepID=A0A9Q0PHQ9_9ROSI|nr:LONG CHAIN BASE BIOSYNTHESIS 2A-LIKE PROTEIN [Salix koriyanagi]
MVKIPFFLALSTYFSFGLLFVFGQVRDFFRKIFDFFHSSNLQGYAPICSGQEDFIVRRLYHRVQDCFGRPISSAPDVWFDIVHRYSNDNNKTMRRTSKVTRCLNLGSYNYLGFAAADEFCTPRVIETLNRFSPSTCSPRVDGVFGMGYATNTATLPVLIGKGGLIISDSLNHNSIINGARGSGATIRVFQHNSKLNVIVVFSLRNK